MMVCPDFSGLHERGLWGRLTHAQPWWHALDRLLSRAWCQLAWHMLVTRHAGRAARHVLG